MSYATPADAIEIANKNDLAARLYRDSSIVDGTLLELTIYEQDRSAYSAEQIAAADAAHDRLKFTLSGASDIANSYLGASPYVYLPLDSPYDRMLVRSTVWLTNAELYGDGKLPEAMVEKQEQAYTFLREVRDGKRTLGGTQTSHKETRGNKLGSTDYILV